MVNPTVIKQRINQLSTSLKKIEKYKGLSLDEFLEDDVVQDVVEYNLFIIVNMMIDIATHIVVDNNLGNPETLGGAFDILYKEKYIDEAELKIYRNMVGLRNILSHEYLKINKNIIYDILQKNLIDIKRFIILVDGKFL